MTKPIPDWQAARLTALLDALGDTPVFDHERRSLTWLAGFEPHTTENFCALFERCREQSTGLESRLHDAYAERNELRGELLKLEDALGRLRERLTELETGVRAHRPALVELAPHALADVEAAEAYLRGVTR